PSSKSAISRTDISQLRKALGDGPGERYIETIPRRGNRFGGSFRKRDFPACGELRPCHSGCRRWDRLHIRRRRNISRHPHLRQRTVVRIPLGRLHRRVAGAGGLVRLLRNLRQRSAGGESEIEENSLAIRKPGAAFPRLL